MNGTATSLSDKVLLTDDALIKVLRDAVAPVGKRASWLRHLNDRQLAEVYWRLRDGQPAHRVTRYVQNEWGIQRQSATKSLARSVRDFRDKVLGELGTVTVSTGRQPNDMTPAKEISKELAIRAQRVGGKINVLEHYAWLIGLQSERIEQLREREKASIPFRHTSNDVRILGELLGQYARLQIELGVVPSVPQEFNLKVKHSFQGLVDQMGGDGSKAVTALDNFLKWADDNSVQMVQDPESGSYVPVKQ